MNEYISNQETRPVTINSTDTDYKAEVIVAGLIEKGIHREDICIFRDGSAARGYSKDIARIETGYFLKSRKDFLGIVVNRKGFYDMLPEGIFHRTKGNTQQKSKGEVIDEIRTQRKEEQNARLFFRPLEVSVSDVLVNAQLFERRLDKKRTNRNFSSLFSRYWPILDILPLDKAVLFIEIISVIPDMGHRMDFSAQIFSALLDIPVEIKMGKKYRTTVRKGILPIISDMQLGVNSVIGRSFESEYQEILIRMGPMTGDKIKYYNMDEKGRRIMDYLAAALLPADHSFRFEYIPLPDEAGFTLSSSFLGINTFINNKSKTYESAKQQSN